MAKKILKSTIEVLQVDVVSRLPRFVVHFTIDGHKCETDTMECVDIMKTFCLTNEELHKLTKSKI